MPHRSSGAGTGKELRELAAGEPSLDRHDAVVAGRRMETECKRGNPETGGRHWGPPEVSHYYTPAGHTIEFLDQVNGGGSREMVKQEAGDDDVDGTIWEGQCSRVGYNGT